MSATMVDKARAWDAVAKAHHDERKRVAAWLRYDLAMNHAANSFVLNCLADAIERGEHLKRERHA